MKTTFRGRCFCSAVSFNIEGPILSCVNCHCDSCRRQCSAPMTSYLGVPDTQWRWTGEEPKVHCSSPGVERTFCDQCGSPISFKSASLSGVMHFYVAAMEHPESFEPTLHVAHEEKLPWLSVGDDLPTRNGPSYL